MLEVLIAATILIAVIGVSTAAYNTAVRSKILARKHIEVSQAMPFILSSIKREIRATSGNSQEGEGQQGDVSFNWQARTLEYAPPFPIVDAESGTLTEYEDRYRLWEVTLELVYKDYRREFQLREVSW